MTSRERERSRSRIRSRVVIAVLIGSIVTLGFLGALLVPLYTYPGVSWTAIINAKEANQSVGMVAIINPDNGPGVSKDQNYVTGIQNLRAAGVVVLGYDHTSYGARPLATVEADINTYKSWYNVSGIFFDEMSNVAGFETYYSTLNQYAKSVGLDFTVGNPGSGVPASYIGTMDVIVGYEDQGVPNTASLESMTNGVPANHFAVIAYGVSVYNDSAVSNIYNYASYVYVTNDTLPNPYGALTGDFSKLVDFLASPFQSSVSLSVNSISGAGTPIAGVYTVVSSANGAVVTSGNTPLTTSVTKGSDYLVSVANPGNFVFEHWDDGSTSATQTVAVTGGTTLTAIFGSPAPTTASLNVESYALDGTPLPGLTASVSSNGNTVATGVTPLTFTGTIGQSYTVSIGSYTGYVFDDWSGGSTSQSSSVTLTQDATLTAFFTASAATSTSTSVVTTSTSTPSASTSTLISSSSPTTSTTATGSTTSTTGTPPHTTTSTGSTDTTTSLASTTLTSSTVSSRTSSSTAVGPSSSFTSSTSSSSSAYTVTFPASDSTLILVVGALVLVIAVGTLAVIVLRHRGSGRILYR